MPGELFRPDNHLSGEGVALVVDALRLRRSDDLPADMRSHVEDCALCKESILSLYELVADEVLPDRADHPFFGRRHMSHGVLYRIAAGLAVVLGGSVLAVYLLGESPDDAVPTAGSAAQIQQAPAESLVTSPPTEDLFVQNFVPSDDLEGIVGGGLRSESMEVLSPAIGGEVREYVRFAWRAAEDLTPVLEVLTNREEVLVREVAGGGRFVLRRQLPPGLYYWKLMSDGELLYVGKFFVRR